MRLDSSKFYCTLQVYRLPNKDASGCAVTCERGRRLPELKRELIGSWWFDKAGLRFDVTVPLPQPVSVPGPKRRQGEHSGYATTCAAPCSAVPQPTCPPARLFELRQYAAYHHPNVFGAAPTMTCGVVTRDRHCLTQACGTFQQNCAGAACCGGACGCDGGVGGAAAASKARGSIAARLLRRPFLSPVSFGAKGAACFAEPATPAPPGLLRWRARMLRPVVATFTAMGNGRDTHDPDYHHRRVL